MQEALERGRHALAADPGIEPRPWLLRVVRNGALNDLRDNRKHEHQPLVEQMDGVDRPQDVLERREDLAALVAAMGKLPASQRDAIVKRELEGRSHAEIAGVLALSTGAVRQLIHRARCSLREALGALVPAPVIRHMLLSRGEIEGAGAGIAAAAGAGGMGTLKVAALVAATGGTLFAGAALHGADGDPGADSAQASARPTLSAPGTYAPEAPGAMENHRQGRGDGSGTVEQGPSNGATGGGDTSGDATGGDQEHQTSEDPGGAEGGDGEHSGEVGEEHSGDLGGGEITGDGEESSGTGGGEEGSGVGGEVSSGDGGGADEPTEPMIEPHAGD